MKEDNFETKIQVLEQIVSDLEKGDLNLDDSIAKFEDGIKISKECNKILEEAKKITSEQGYTLKSETLTESDIMIGDSKVFDFIKEASIEGGYSKDDFNSITEDRKIVGYELEEKSKIDEPIMLCMVIDKGKVIGAYLDYSGYMPGIVSIDFKDNFK